MASDITVVFCGLIIGELLFWSLRVNVGYQNAQGLSGVVDLLLSRCDSVLSLSQKGLIKF